MKILYVSSEAAPFSKTGGLGDVAGSLPIALCQKGVDARVIVPLYRCMAQEYKEKVLEILGELIGAEISESTVKDYLNAMMLKGLIPREYADYVISKRKTK